MHVFNFTVTPLYIQVPHFGYSKQPTFKRNSPDIGSPLYLVGICFTKAVHSILLQLTSFENFGNPDKVLMHFKVVSLPLLDGHFWCCISKVSLVVPPCEVWWILPLSARVLNLVWYTGHYMKKISRNIFSCSMTIVHVSGDQRVMPQLFMLPGQLSIDVHWTVTHLWIWLLSWERWSWYTPGGVLAGIPNTYLFNLYLKR